MSRPDGLPDFTNPPLTEVAISIQFATPPRYSEAYISEIWALFKADFPNVQEMPALPPTFEVFGGPELPSMQMNVGLNVLTTFAGGASALRNRYWFLNESETELMQFQQDRLIHNWRKRPGQNNDYPRYDPLFSKFKQELEKVESYFSSKSWGALTPNQCELTYVNQMSLHSDIGQPLAKSSYFRNIDVSIGDDDASEFSFNLRKPIMNDGAQVGRLFVEAATAVDSSGSPIIGLNLTARGRPAHGTSASALEFLESVRVLIDTTFVEFTSDTAHQKWGRTQ